jgi:hypothetical protein
LDLEKNVRVTLIVQTTTGFPTKEISEATTIRGLGQSSPPQIPLQQKCAAMLVETGNKRPHQQY